jgi:hypothetical protein
MEERYESLEKRGENGLMTYVMLSCDSTQHNGINLMLA